ncbi:5474_t:CDS:2 [Diversispora eburnea]|uniref:5474_t:CDS:1 n=1 Tax=Diversispora eburnea TaxID=1213867 RepID=A0A9N9GCS7_9GLOM|nr:5474_t:CDS:2 [Diversispora eburnea]
MRNATIPDEAITNITEEVERILASKQESKIFNLSTGPSTKIMASLLFSI